ncbi:hypothetical protein J2S36_000977 [Arcanobacterium hippocoleae]|uniref:Uncharacterized protein n=1 Tax=Arcanobacterium hippocoleae TaxID=149017 RepID=A0ABU1T253_9ACTO|nr:hypothetical protein [Arcanobacterium hippocoleae]
MLCDVGGANLAPARAVAGVDLRIPLVAPVACVLCLGVGLAVAFTGELGATRVGAWAGWFDRHRWLPSPWMW